MLGHLLDYQHGVEIAEPAPAQRLRNGHAEESAGPQAFDLVPRIGFGPVDLGGARRHVGFGHRAGARLQLLMGGREFEIHRRSPGCAPRPAMGAAAVLDDSMPLDGFVEFCRLL